MEEVLEEVVPIMATTMTQTDAQYQLRHRQDLEIIDAQYQLKSCTGMTSDKRLIILISSIVISLITVGFSCFQLTRNGSCESQHTYVGLLTLVIGVWLKSPAG